MVFWQSPWKPLFLCLVSHTSLLDVVHCLLLPKDLFFRNSDFHNMLDALPTDACCTMMLDLSHVARQTEMRDLAGQQSSQNTFS